MGGGDIVRDIIEIYDNYTNVGIKNRTITEGKEIELVRDYINFRKDRFKATENRKLAIFLESKVDNAYPDIVFVEYNPENYLDWNNARSILGKEDLKVLYHIYARGEVQSTELVRQLGIAWKDVLLTLERLYDSNLITRKCGSWKLINEKKISTYKIEAVEAKLNQWDQVLQQSIINKNFASESYALSLAKLKPKKEVLTKFNRFGVGVCLKNGDTFDVIKEAKKNDIPVSFNSIFFNEWIGRILSTGEDFVNAN